MILAVTGRQIAALAVCVPILILAVIVGGTAGLIIAAMFLAILIAILTEPRR